MYCTVFCTALVVFTINNNNNISDGTIHRIVSNIAILKAYRIVMNIAIIPALTIRYFALLY